MIDKISILTLSVKKAMYGIMTAGALTLGAGKMVAGNSTSPIQNQYPTEQMAEASKANAVSTPVYSYEKNKKLDNTFLRFAETSEDKEVINNYVKQLYAENGTFGGSILIQQSINYNALNMFMAARTNDSYKKASDIAESLGYENFAKKCEKDNETLDKWINESYYPLFFQVITKLATVNGKPGSAQMYSDALDNIAKVNLKGVLIDSDIKRYETETSDFRAKQKDKYSVQGWSDYLAFKTYLIETMAFERVYKSMNSFETMPDQNGHNEIYYYRTIMGGYKPTP